MPTTNGFFNYGTFTPTTMQQIEISASVFKNKAWYIGINQSWGKNEVISYGYIADASNNTITEYKSSSSIHIKFMGYFVRKNIELKQCGTLQAFIGFNPGFSFDRLTNVRVQQRSNTTGNLLYTGNAGGGGEYAAGRWGLLMLFDNPKIGLNYSVKIYHHIRLMFSYSYCLGNTMVNDFYGISNRFVIPFKNSGISIPSRSRNGYKDLFSHNLSVGLCIQLKK